MGDPSVWESIVDWSETSGMKIVGIVVVIWVIRKFGDMAIRRSIRKAIAPDKFASARDEEQREDTLISIVSATVRVVLWVVGLMLVVQQFGVDIGPLVAGASVIGVALGFGSQSLVKDFVSGLFIIMENQYRVGDSVNIAGEDGKVEAITMRETVMRNIEGEVIHIPNGLVGIAKNKTMEFASINMNLGVSYDSDLKKVQKVINEVGVELSNDKEWTDKIIEALHFVRVNGFGASEVEIKVMGKVEAGKQWSVAGEFRARIKEAFDKNKIEIPFPQIVVHKEK